MGAVAVTDASVLAGLCEAQRTAVALFDAIEEQQLVRAGQSEQQIGRAITDIAGEVFDSCATWHPNMVRSGANTLLTFADEATNRIVAEDDIVYVDLGPVFVEHRADFARTWVLGEDAHKWAIARDAERDLAEGMQRMREQPDMTGEQVYAMVGALAQRAGWQYRAAIAGHIVGHEHDVESAKFKTKEVLDVILAPGAIKPLNRRRPDGLSYHWVLEIHYVDTARSIGAFFEDIVTI